MISVAMATYNGEAHLERQLKSILAQLSPEDEVVISDDGSTDRTLAVVTALKDPRIRVLKHPRSGVAANFELAIKNTRGDYIFLSDQDDEWLPGKVQAVLAAFAQTSCPVVMHDGIVVREDGTVMYDSLFKLRQPRAGLMRNLIKNSYFGSAMAFRREFMPKFLPIRAHRLGNLHDTWIGLIAELNGGVYLLDQVLYKYYRYATSVTDANLHPLAFHRQVLKRLITYFHLLEYALCSHS